MTSHSRLVATPSPFSSAKTSYSEQEQPHLSGAYIRSLVKQLSFSSSTARSRAQHLNTMASATPLDHQQQPQQEKELKPQVKKQVRRRMHTSRPYQERLLNMAEARREIVTALKIHRANMRQQSRYQPEQLQRQQQQVQVVFQEQSQAVEGVPMAAPMSYGSFSNHSHNSPLAHLIAGTTVSTVPGSYSSSSHDYLTPLEVPAIGGLDDHGLEHLACSLPAQPPGLNLSFQGFAGSVDDAKDCDDLFGIPLIQPSPASSYSAYSSPAMEMASTHGSPALSTTEKCTHRSMHRLR